MRFNYIILILLLLQYGFFIKAQNQDSHIFSRYSSQPKVTELKRKQISNIPYYQPKENLKLVKSISYIDNSTLKFFPPIFNQLGNSCSQASGIRYIFSYEINRLRDADASLSKNVFSYHYTWNFLNGGTDVGSWYYDGYKLVKDNGVPSLVEFNDEDGLNERTWMSGYDNYYKAMHNRIASYSRIDAGLVSNLDIIKQYLLNHGDGSETGGLLNFSGKSSNWQMISYSGPSNTGYNYAIRNFGNGGDHAMTIVGFDDLVEIDVNSDGIIQDEERGAFIIVNSWGIGWGSQGRAYMPYKLLYKSWWNGGMGNGDHDVYMLEAKDHEPTVVARVNLKYTSRNDLWIVIGVAESENAESQDRAKTIRIMKKQGGDFYMCGGNSETEKTIEVGIDYSDLIEKVPNAKKYFLKIKQSPEGELGTGMVKDFTIIDYRKSRINPNLYQSQQRNINIEPTTILTTSIRDFVGIKNKTFKNDFLVYPNPIKIGSRLNIRQDKVKIKHIELLTISGKVILIQNVVSKDNMIKVKIPSKISGGVCILKIHTNNNILYKKIMIY